MKATIASATGCTNLSACRYYNLVRSKCGGARYMILQDDIADDTPHTQVWHGLTDMRHACDLLFEDHNE